MIVTLAGHSVASCVLHVPGQGPWFAELDLTDAPEFSGRVELRIGDTLTLSGTVRPTHDGTFGTQRRTLVVAGADGWAQMLPARSLTNSRGVEARAVAQDAADAVGERLGGFAPGSARLGGHYVREAGVASRVLEDAIRGALWWVDRAGVTQVAGARTGAALEPGTYQAIGYDPRERVLELSVDDPAALDVGCTVTDPNLPEPVTIRSYELRIEGDKLRVLAWCGEGRSSKSVDLVRSIVARATDGRVPGIYRYRVVNMSGARVNVQALGGAPADIRSVQMWGAPGIHAELTPGSEVLVQFVDNDRSQPVITGFIGRGPEGHVPQSLELAGEDGPAAARLGDSVEVLLPPLVFTGTIAGSPASGVLSGVTSKALGTITAGSSRVKVAT